jgi:hypothetical protein
MLDLKVEQVVEQARALFEDSRPQFGPARAREPKATAD